MWYSLSLVGRGQGYVAPVLLFATALVVLTTNDTGALTGSYAACATAQFACMTWLSLSLLNAEDAIQRTVTAVNAGGGHRILLANVIAATLIGAALTAAGLVYPIVAGHHVVGGVAVAVGALAQSACGTVGIAIGLLCCRYVIPRAGYAVLVAVVLVGLFFVVPGLPPVGPLLTLISGNADPATMLAPAAGLTALAAALLCGSYATVVAVARRRD